MAFPRLLVGADRRVKFSLSDGKVLQGMRRESLSVEDAKNLAGRTLDLDAAYKQLLTAKSSLWCSVLAVEDLTRTIQLFISNVLPFGASASVYGFNRIARACCVIGVRLFGLIWGNYYDDYPQLDLAASMGNAQHAAERLFKLIGWRVSMKDSKRMPMAKQFDALGVTFDFNKSQPGVIEVKNKLSRVEGCCAELTAVEDSGILSVSCASSSRGKLQFAETHTFGRVLASHLKLFNLRASGKLSGSDVSEDTREEIEWIKNFLWTSAPRRLLSGMSDRRLCIFTDATLEDYDTVGSVGIVAFYIEAGSVSRKFFFSNPIPSDLMQCWQAETKKVIATLELFAGVYALHLLSAMFQHVRVMLFVDNEAARASLISLKTGVERRRAMLKKLSQCIQQRGLYVWTARVPSSSNGSDEPSRLVVGRVLEEGFDRLQIDWHEAKAMAPENKCQCMFPCCYQSCRACPRRDKPMRFEMLMYNGFHFQPSFHADVASMRRRLGNPTLQKRIAARLRTCGHMVMERANN